MQSWTFYRVARRRIAGEISIVAASPVDIVHILSRLNPGLPVRPPVPNPLVTRLVANRHGRVCGFVELVRHPPEDAPYVGHWLFGLIVLDPLDRGLGIGEALARRVVEMARSEGAGELWLVVAEKNVPAIGLYRKLGFERSALEGLEDLLEEGAGTTGRRRITMVKVLHE